MLKTPFQMIAKPAGPLCNQACSYCFYLEKEQLFGGEPARQKSAYVMSQTILETYIQQKLTADSSPEQHFVWQGGEPTLLGVDYFRRVVQLQQQYSAGKRIKNAFQTNGMLLDDTWCEFLKENDFIVGLSLDGPRELHDKYRVDKQGQPTFDQVMLGLELLTKHQVEFNTLTTVHHGNARFPQEVYHFLKDVGSQFMQFIPIVERTGAPNALDLSEHSVEAEQYSFFLNTVFDEWVRYDVGQVFIQNFDVALEAWSGRPSSLCVFSETCGLNPVIEHNGDLFACDHYVYPEYKFGNVLTDSLASFIQSPQQLKFGQDKRDTLPPECLNCEYRFACHGGCPKHRFLKTAAGEPGLNYLCSAYKAYFKHIDPYLKFMANELRERRSPANVMSWIKESDSS